MSFLDKPDVESISNITTLLHLFLHRNRNQHRRSIWWRHFSVFRRQVNALEDDLKRLTVVPATHVERTKLKAETPQIRARIEQRIDSWPIAKWHHSFSQLTADGRFAQLGIVLLAALAQICAVVGLTSHLETLGESEIQQVLHNFGREHWQAEDVPALVEPSEDVGAVVSRDVVETAHQEPTRVSVPSKVQTKTLRKGKKRNAIDELFGGL